MPEGIRAKITRGEFEFTQHAVDQGLLRRITVRELHETIEVGEVIENYPEDKYGPSCLILGFTRAGRPLHVQCSDPARPLVKIITLYQPNAERWVNLRVKRS
jgi:hypothetical protein